MPSSSRRVASVRSRDELIEALALAMLTNDDYAADPENLATDASNYADALIARRTPPAPSPGTSLDGPHDASGYLDKPAPSTTLRTADSLARVAVEIKPSPVEPGAYVPKRGDLVTWGSCDGVYEIVGVDGTELDVTPVDQRWPIAAKQTIQSSERGLRLATPAERVAAGLDKPVSPAATRPTHVRVTNPFKHKVTKDRVYEVVETHGHSVRIINDENQPLWCGGIAWEPCAPPAPDAQGEAKFDEAKEREAANAAWHGGESDGWPPDDRLPFVKGWLAARRTS